MQTKDNKYIANLFRNYKRNKARVRILELGMVNDEDYLIGSIDYSADNVQTSNKSDLSDKIIKREHELNKLRKDIAITEILLDSIDSRKDSQYMKLIQNYYIENKTKNEVMTLVNVYDDSAFFYLCRVVLNSLLELI